MLVYKTSDNTSIFLRNCGVAAAGDSVVRIVPDIEAPTSGSYAWLNTTKLVGTRKVAGDKITLDIYDVSKAAAGSVKVQLKDPAGVPNTAWDCVTGSGSKGDSVFTENVTLGSSFSVSNAKRGSRNIIPITGGTTTGKVAGKILDGGADYQLKAPGPRSTRDTRWRPVMAPSSSCATAEPSTDSCRRSRQRGRPLQVPQRRQVPQLGPGLWCGRRQYHFLRAQVVCESGERAGTLDALGERQGSIIDTPTSQRGTAWPRRLPRSKPR